MLPPQTPHKGVRMFLDPLPSLWRRRVADVTYLVLWTIGATAQAVLWVLLGVTGAYMYLRRDPSGVLAIPPVSLAIVAVIVAVVAGLASSFAKPARRWILRRGQPS